MTDEEEMGGDTAAKENSNTHDNDGRVSSNTVPPRGSADVALVREPSNTGETTMVETAVSQSESSPTSQTVTSTSVSPQAPAVHNASTDSATSTSKPVRALLSKYMLYSV